MPPNESWQASVQIDAGEQADAAELDELTSALQRELLELDVRSVERSSAGPPPEGARAVEVAIVGQLIVGLGRPALKGLIDAVRDFVSRSRARTITLELNGDKLTVGNATAEQQRALIESFLARHQTG